MNRICLFFLVLVVLTSCEKVIVLDLNTADTQLVIEANLSADKGQVKLSKTVNFDQSNVYPSVSGAVVKMTNGEGQTVQFKETTTGVYETTALTGKVGQKYQLDVQAEGKTYHAESQVPKTVAFTTITVRSQAGSGSSIGPGSGNKSGYEVEASFTDPASETNYYRFILTINNKATDDVFVYDDRLSNGETSNRILRTSQTISKGDVVGVEMQCIDENVYAYFNSFKRLAGGPTDSSTPANPITNISGPS
ncbi:DUF4249 family protein [Spirosoma sp. HMF3257]|uniref:DUF4249 domain-containing protein n=1 Tax=Spirosoma telluris TaxID=2183553 RepID=A0A327NS41_9BACT|nr:DUF4249 family protein [Spirosoma telluris]RAI75558.1 DUF4249 domain-containing protein [Spirosoma telluris]